MWSQFIVGEEPFFSLSSLFKRSRSITKNQESSTYKSLGLTGTDEAAAAAGRKRKSAAKAQEKQEIRKTNAKKSPERFVWLVLVLFKPPSTQDSESLNPSGIIVTGGYGFSMGGSTGTLEFFFCKRKHPAMVRVIEVVLGTSLKLPIKGGSSSNLESFRGFEWLFFVQRVPIEKNLLPFGTNNRPWLRSLPRSGRLSLTTLTSQPM